MNYLSCTVNYQNILRCGTELKDEVEQFLTSHNQVLYRDYDIWKPTRKVATFFINNESYYLFLKMKYNI
jgi:hypothetical protein